MLGLLRILDTIKGFSISRVRQIDLRLAWVEVAVSAMTVVDPRGGGGGGHTGPMPPPPLKIIVQ